MHSLKVIFIKRKARDQIIKCTILEVGRTNSSLNPMVGDIEAFFHQPGPIQASVGYLLFAIFFLNDN